MKNLCLVILTFVALYNPKVAAKTNDVDLRSLERFQLDLANISIDKTTPMKNIDENLAKFTILKRMTKEVQVHNINLSQKLLTKIQNHNTFSGDDLYLIKRSSEVFFNVSIKMLELGKLYQFKPSVMSKTFASTQMNTDLIKGHLIWLNSNILTMESIENVHKILYLNEKSFRRIFKNSFDPKDITIEQKNSLKAMTNLVDELGEVLASRKFSQQIILIREIADKIAVPLKDDLDAMGALNEIKNNDLATQMARGRKDFNLDLYTYSDATVGVFNKVTNFLSGFFGNVMGRIRSRKGHLYRNESILALTKKSLIPMDIILEKSPFVLTDKFIPGHYGHVAIYLGTKEQLINLGMWTHPDIVPYQADIEAGKTILEAVRSGVRLNSVEEFLNIDEYTVVRKTDGLKSLDQVSEQINRGINQLGKAYDFNFDISTLDKIVCSELIYIVFGHVTWPTRYRFGRPTVTPDDIGEVLFLKNTAFKMTDYVGSTKRQKPIFYDINHLAEIYGYELRAENGGPVLDSMRSSNSFWKKETKCYNVSSSEFKKKSCKVTYKEYTYEEDSGI
jgi:hypothetical protein